MNKLRIMTNNVWSCGKNQPWWQERGLDCSSYARAPKFARVYKETMPDMIGWQESDAFFRNLVIPEMTRLDMNYELITAGCTSILYNKDTLTLCESHFVPYPESMPGYEGVFNNAGSKSYGIAVFKAKESDKHIIFASTHLWWKSANPENKHYYPHSSEARAFQLNMLLDAIEPLRTKYSCPAVVVGDLNDTYNSLALKTAFDRGYRHAHDIAVEYADDRDGYHFCFPEGYKLYENPKPFEKGIDHILIKGEPEGFVRRFERYTPDYYMPLSDHFPAWADVEI